MAMTRRPGADTTLGCGRDADDVWASIGAPLDAHELRCPYCEDARASLTELAAATREIAAADRANPILRVPAQAMAHIMTIARTEMRRGRTLPLRQPHPDRDGSPGDPPDLSISELAVASVVRQTCDEIAGVQARRCGVRPTSDPDEPRDDTSQLLPSGQGGDGRPPPARIAVTLTVSVARDASIPTLVSELRRRVTADVAAQIGVAVSRIDVRVEDVHDA